MDEDVPACPWSPCRQTDPHLFPHHTFGTEELTLSTSTLNNISSRTFQQIFNTSFNKTYSFTLPASAVGEGVSA